MMGAHGLTCRAHTSSSCSSSVEISWQCEHALCCFGVGVCDCHRSAWGLERQQLDFSHYKTSGTGLENLLLKWLCPAGANACVFLVGADGYGCKPLLEGLGRTQHASARTGVLACATSKMAPLKHIWWNPGIWGVGGDAVLGPSTKSGDVCHASS